MAQHFSVEVRYGKMDLNVAENIPGHREQQMKILYSHPVLVILCFREIRACLVPLAFQRKLTLRHTLRRDLRVQAAREASDLLRPFNAHYCSLDVSIRIYLNHSV